MRRLGADGLFSYLNKQLNNKVFLEDIIMKRRILSCTMILVLMFTILQGTVTEAAGKYSAAVKAYEKFMKKIGGFEYCIEDFNNDGVPELIVNQYGFYRYKNGKIKSVGYSVPKEPSDYMMNIMFSSYYYNKKLLAVSFGNSCGSGNMYAKYTGKKLKVYLMSFHVWNNKYDKKGSKVFVYKYYKGKKRISKTEYKKLKKKIKASGSLRLSFESMDD